MIGSPLYMSPEQCKGEELDGRADVYSLGCIMYEVLSGRAPFHDNNPMKVFLKHLTDEAPPLPKEVVVPADL